MMIFCGENIRDAGGLTIVGEKNMLGQRTGSDQAAVAAEWSLDATNTASTTGAYNGPQAVPARTLVVWMLGLLLLVDVLLLTANVAYRIGDGQDSGFWGTFAATAWDGDTDGSHIEIWGHIQLLLAAGLLVMLARQHKQLVFTAWAWLMFVVVVDDFFQVHESLGEVMAGLFNGEEVAGLRTEDLGELLTWGLLAMLLVPPLVVGFFTATRWARRTTLVLCAILALLVVFAIGLDMANILLHDHISGPATTVVTLAETAGELVPMTLFLAYTVKVAVLPSRRSA